MDKRVVHEAGAIRVVAMDSVSIIGAEDVGHVIVAASNGGAASGMLALDFRCPAFFFNDAGIGKDEAGVVGIHMLDEAGVPAGVVGHRSARISDGVDTWENGVLSAVNRAAAAAGFAVGTPLKAAVLRFLGSV